MQLKRWGLLLVVCLTACGDFDATTPPDVSAALTGTAQRPTVTPSPLIATDPPQVTTAPVAMQSPEERYITIAQGSALPNIRKGMGIPEGEWEASVSNLGQGPELEIRIPLNPANDNEQFVQLGKQNIAQIVNALFVADPQLFRITAIGTFPDLGQELPAVSMFVYRSKSDHWGSVARDELESIAEWVDIKPRFR